MQLSKTSLCNISKCKRVLLASGRSSKFFLLSVREATAICPSVMVF